VLVSPFVFLVCAQAVEAQALRRHEFTEMHMGMPVRMVLHAGNDSLARAAARAAFDRVATLDNTFSDYRPQSEVRRLESRSGEWVAVSAELFEVTARALEIARLSEGAFDPTVAPVVALWREARRTKILPSAARIDSARRFVGWRRVRLDTTRRAMRLDSGMRLDFGGIAKGYIIGEARRVLAEAGITSSLVEAGGDIVVGDPPPDAPAWRIDLGDSLTTVVNAAVSSSGPTNQFVEIGGRRYSHVVDPRTGQALANDVLVHVIANDPTIADAASTAFSILTESESARFQARLPSGIRVHVRPATNPHK
jgi:thiamine biosynthesis lipoprotein